MKNLKHIAIVLLIVLVIGSFAVMMVACNDEEETVIKSFDIVLEVNVGDTFNPVVSYKLTDGTSKSLTLLTNSAVVILTENYESALHIEENEDEKLVYTEAGEYQLSFLFCQKEYQITIKVVEEEA